DVQSRNFARSRAGSGRWANRGCARPVHAYEQGRAARKSSRRRSRPGLNHCRNLIYREETMDIVKHVKIFADGADLDGILALYKTPLVKGFTTNPTLMRKAGIDNYEKFARRLVEAIPDRPISFEVFSDDFDEMIAQGRAIASWGTNINVKIPVT